MAALIPRSILFGNPTRTNPQVSPDGTLLGYIAPVDGVLNVWVRTINGDDDRPVTNDTNRGIQSFRWSSDNRHILYIQDSDGDENYHLYAVHIDTGTTRDLTPFENVRVRIVAHNKHFPDNLLLAINRNDPQVHDVYNLHIPSGELRLVGSNPGNFIGWLADPEFKIRIGVTPNADGGLTVYHRWTEDGPWEELLAWNLDDAAGSQPVSFTKDGRSLLMLDSRNANTARLVSMEIATGEVHVIAEDPQYDVTELTMHPDTYAVQYVGFARERMTWEVLDESVREDLETLQTLHPGDLNVVSSDDSDMMWIARFMADNCPVVFYAYDRNTRNATLLFTSRPELKNYGLASMEPVSITARDGLVVHGYITFPPGAERRNLPMVLKVHGGPWVRDIWGYESEAQWLANRGYICLQVNYRGSAGYGKQFLNAGNKEWGGKMHDDLIDAVQWAVNHGYADPTRIAIYGGSYGGYAALVGAAFTPDLFCCAVDIVGPSNLITFIETIPPYWKPNIQLFHDRVGNPDTESDFLKARSPLFKVDDIRIPLLIAQGANDPRVKQSESEQIVEAMRVKGIAHEYMLFEDEGHGFAKPENRMRFYSTAEQFLAQHLGGMFEPEMESLSVA
ncbi:MAG: S9 family peptidase [Bacteroidetes bacterium]|nr:S9 family peptidase [Bacteroidota bacterium]